MNEAYLNCPNISMRLETASVLVHKAIEAVNMNKVQKRNLIWLELTGCSGNIISLLDGADPDFKSLATQMVNIVYDNSLMAAEGELAMEKVFGVLGKDYILAVEGAVATKDGGLYNVIGRFKGEPITAYRAIRELGEGAAYVIAVGTCASDGGISAARPNPAKCVGIQDLLNRKVIKLPGCPCHPDWFMGTLAYILLFGEPAMDERHSPDLMLDGKKKNHAGLDASRGWTYYTTKFIIDQKGTVYEGRVVVRDAKNGLSYFYDLNNIKEAGRQDVSALLNLVTGNTAPYRNLATAADEQASANTPEAHVGTVPNGNISQEESGVKRFSLKTYSNEEKESHVKTALEYFGRTYKWAETGYLTPDGKKIDFSGKNNGAPGGYRTVDHREITDALGLDYGGGDYSGAMVQFMSEGNIRIMPENNGINLSVLPTKAQEPALDDFITKARGEVILDIDDLQGNTVSSTEYPRGTRAAKVLSDMRKYFEDGTKPVVSDVQRFRYSLKDSEGNTLTPEQQEFFKDSKVRDKDGRLQVVYHGTKADFTKFVLGDVGYHVGTKEQAERRASKDGRLMRLYVDIKNPLEIEADYGNWGGTNLALTFLDNDYFEDAELNERFEEILSIDRAIKGKSAAQRKDEAMRKLLQSLGYDGIRYENQFEGKGYSYIAFSPEQIKSVENKNPTSDPDIRYSLKEVAPVEATSGAWKRSITTPVAMGRFPKLWNVTAESSEVRNPTRISSTVSTYRKIYDILKAEDFTGDILDASSGLGYGTMAGIGEYGFNVDDIEHYPDKSYAPKFTDYSKLENSYDVIISNAVLNVLPQDQRDALVVKMGLMLNSGGRIYVNVRGKDVDTLSSNPKNVKIGPMEWFVDSTGSYQKGFTSAELKAYLEDALGDGYSVKSTSAFGAVSAVVTKDDSRYSLKGARNITEEVKQLTEMNTYLKEQVDKLKGQQERAEYWKGQTKRSESVITDRKAVSKYASEIVDNYSSTADVKDVSASLQHLYDYIANGGDGKNELTWEGVKKDASALAYYIVDNAEEMISDDAGLYKEISRYLRSGKLKLSEGAKKSIPDFNSWRKANLPFGISDTGMDVGSAYMELQELYGQGLFPDDIYNEVDQLYHLVELRDSLRPTFENPLGPHISEATEYLANEIIDKFFDLPQTAPTFADRQSQKLTEQQIKDGKKLEKLRGEKNARIEKIKADSAQRIKEAIKREKKFRDKKIVELKERYKSRDAKTRERQNASELRGKIKRHFSKMSQRLLSPTETNHVPKTLAEPVAAFLASVDFVSDRMGEKTINRLNKLKDRYIEISEGAADLYLEIDPDLHEMLVELGRVLESKSVSQMDSKELKNLWNATRAIERTVYDANRALREGERRTISEIGKAAIFDNAVGKGYTGSAFRLLQQIADTANMDMLDSFSFFEELGSTMNSVYGGLRGGLDTKIRHTKEAEEYMQNLLGETKIAEWTGKKAEKTKFGLESGQSIELTPAQAMALYNLNKQKDAQEHIYIGGIKPSPVITTSGKYKIPKITEHFEPVNVSLQDVAKIINSLTDEQRRIADGITDFFTKVTSAWGNEVSNRLYGYDKFTVENYFPIVSDKNYISAVYGETTDQTLKNMGSTKTRIKGANNPLIIEDIFDVYTRQADSMGSYNAFVIPLSDIQKVWNYKTDSGSVRQAVTKKFGSRAESYFRKFLVDLNGGIRSDAGSALLNSMMGRYKAARVGANLRVIVQQPTAYLRASAIIDGKYLAAGAVMKTDWNKVLKWSPIAQWKDWGYFNFDTGKQMKDVFLGEENMGLINKLGDKAMAGAGWADRIAWARLWNACELEVADKNEGLTKGADEFYKAVSARFSQVIDRTQVIDTVFHRSQLMRSGDTAVKMATAFMSEPTKSYNLLRSAVRAAVNEKTPEAKNRLVRTAFAFVLTAAVNNIITGLMDAWRDDDDDEKKFSEKWLNHFAENMVNELPSMLPYVRDIYSLWQGYSVDRMDMSAIGDLIEAVQRASKDKYTIGFKITDLSGKIADLIGVPVSSVKREIGAAANNIFRLSGSVELEYKATKLFYDIKSSDNRGVYYALLYNAKKSGDKYYGTMYAEMLAAGYSDSLIRGAMESKMKKDEGVKKSEDLSERYLAPEQKKAYDGYISKAAGSRIYSSASNEQRGIIEDVLYQYSIGSKDSDNKKIDDGASVGVDPAEYALFKAALDMVDANNTDPKKRNKSYDQDEAEAAADMLLGLSKSERAYLWASVNSGWAKSGKNPYN